VGPVTLFDLPDQPAQPAAPPESAGRRLTRRNNDLIARGIHPATRQPIVAALGTCGTCARAHRYDHHNRTYWKCDLHRLGQSHSAASDVRVSWPACDLHTTREDG
jgi:hypothetical protein